MDINFRFDDVFFEDLPAEDKSINELIILVMKYARGDKIKNNKYSRYEIEKMARKLVIEGFIRGTPLDNDKCVWSTLTRRGELWLEITERQNKY